MDKSDTFVDFKAPAWLPGGHLQTIVPAKFYRCQRPAYRRERWTTPDQDFIDVDFIDGQPGEPFLVLFHGLEGSSDSYYARMIMNYIEALGWSGAVPHFRSCSGEINHGPRFYHSGDTEELDWILRRLDNFATARQCDGFYAVGASLGGNVLLRWLGETGRDGSIVRAACAISAPLDLAAGGYAISRGISRIYSMSFLKTMKRKALQKLDQYPDLYSRDAIRRCGSLYDFDNIVTAPLHGFRDTDDYWDRASARHVLHHISAPTLILNARNDPFLPAHALPASAASCVILEYPDTGGHLGFSGGRNPYWLPERIIRFLTR